MTLLPMPRHPINLVLVHMIPGQKLTLGEGELRIRNALYQLLCRVQNILIWLRQILSALVDLVLRHRMKFNVQSVQVIQLTLLIILYVGLAEYN